jgi:diguanylate cyclase (GGDEF)-like protein
MLLVGIVKFRGANSALINLSSIVALVTIAVFFYFSLLTPSVSLRIETRCVLVVLVSGVAIYANLSGHKEDDSVAKRLLTLVLAMNIIYMVFRCWFAYAESPIVDYFSSSVVHKLSFLVAAATMLLTTFSIVWMLIRRVLIHSYYSSITDELTGLYNRKGLRERYSELSNNVGSYPVGVILADLDHFKIVNDTFGHEMGDITIVHFADLLKRVYRSDDICVRYGGEEFLLLIPKAGMHEAFDVANRVKEAAQIESKANQYVCDYTVSMGVTVLGFNENIHQAIKRADCALYRAKAKGRNTVTSYPHPQPDETVLTN